MMVAGPVWRMLAGSPGFFTRYWLWAGAFHGSWAGAFGAFGDQQGGDVGQVFGVVQGAEDAAGLGCEHGGLAGLLPETAWHRLPQGRHAHDGADRRGLMLRRHSGPENPAHVGCPGS